LEAEADFQTASAALELWLSAALDVSFELIVTENL